MGGPPRGVLEGGAFSLRFCFDWWHGWAFSFWTCMGVGFDGSALWMEGLRFQRSTGRPLAPHQRERAIRSLFRGCRLRCVFRKGFASASGDRPNGFPYDPSYLVQLTILPGVVPPVAVAIRASVVPRVYAPAGGAQGQRFLRSSLFARNSRVLCTPPSHD